jgi:hypothetical protein
LRLAAATLQQGVSLLQAQKISRLSLQNAFEWNTTHIFLQHCDGLNKIP